MTIAWPGSLPTAPLTDTTATGPKQGTARIDFGTEVGPGKTRARSAIVERAYTLTFRLTAAQRVTFLTFFETTSAQGVLPFTMTDAFDSSTGTFVFDREQPYGLRPYGQIKWDLTVHLIRRIPG